MRARAQSRRMTGALITFVLVVGTLSFTVTPAVGQDDDAGTIRIAAEEELACADWIASCAAVSWGNWVLGNLTLPQAFVVNAAGDYVPGDLLVDEPTLEAGPPMRITYRIKPEAVWSDGEPISSADFEYTWQQIVNSKDIYDTTGYDNIESIDTTDPKVAVVTFEEPFAGWRDLFGGFYYVMPSHLLPEKEKGRHRAMKDGYEFSGGPWMLEGGADGWEKGRTLTLVPNDAYWGIKPTIERVIFQFVPKQTAQVRAVTSGQVVAAYPKPIEGIFDQVEATENLASILEFGNQAEAFYFNADRFPLDSQAVRQAIAYATDRDVIVDQILAPSVREGRVLQSFIVPTFRRFYTPAFERYAQDLAMVDELMTGDGWAKNDDGIWEKDGETASFEVSTTTGDPTRELVQEVWQSQLQAAGFELTIRNRAAEVLFGRLAPRGRFHVLQASLVGTPDPGLCSVFCSKNFPPEGQNFFRTDDPTIDESLELVDESLDDAARVAAAMRGQEALAEYVAGIPLYQLPTIFIYDDVLLGGRLENNTVMGPFFTMNEWTLEG